MVLCDACAAPARARCGRCGVGRYCGTVCQKSDWSRHKAWCGRGPERVAYSGGWKGAVDHLWRRDRSVSDLEILGPELVRRLKDDPDLAAAHPALAAALAEHFDPDGRRRRA